VVFLIVNTQKEKGPREADAKHDVVDEHRIGDTDLEFAFELFVCRVRCFEKGCVLAAAVVAPAADFVESGLPRTVLI